MGQTPYHLAMVNTVINNSRPGLLNVLVEYGANVLTIDKVACSSQRVGSYSVFFIRIVEAPMTQR